MINWNALVQEHLQKLIRINTTNPPGNETEACRYIAKVLDSINISYEIVEPLPRRGSIIARLEGTAEKSPLLLLSHLDVVPAVASDWKHDPFSGTLANGYIWGRGALDIKYLTAVWLTLLQKFKADGVSLKRDLIFAATADEEAGGRKGLKWIVENKPHLVHSHMALNEGGGNAFTFGKKKYITYQSGEKASCPIRLIATGTAGHASIPIRDNSVAKLGKALETVHRTRLPAHSTDTVQAFMRMLAKDMGLLAGKAMEIALSAGQIQRLLNRVVKNPYEKAAFQAMLSNTATPTMLRAGQKTNVIPSSAHAQLDGRILPGQTAKDLARELRAILPESIEIKGGQGGKTTESKVDTPLAQIIRQVVPRHLPGAKAIPFLLPASTDARYLRPRGVTVYGFAPLLPGENISLAHGVDERISLKSLEFCFRVLEDVVTRVATQ